MEMIVSTIVIKYVSWFVDESFLFSFPLFSSTQPLKFKIHFVFGSELFRTKRILFFQALWIETRTNNVLKPFP